MSKDFDSKNLNIGEFDIFRKDRNEGNNPHGGVMICVNKKLNAKNVEIETDFEICFVELMLKNISYKIGALYRPPSLDHRNSMLLTNIMRNQLENSRRFVMCRF